MEFAGFNLVSRSFVNEKRFKPVGARTSQTFVGEIRPFIAFRPPQEFDTRAQLQGRLAPWQTAQTCGNNALRQNARGFSIWGHLLDLLGQND